MIIKHYKKVNSMSMLIYVVKKLFFFTDRFIKRTLSVKQCIFTVNIFVCAQNLLGQYQRR